MTGKPVNPLQLFSQPLALAADDYEILREKIKGLGRDAEKARDNWVANGDRKDLTTAQTQGIQGAVLNGLCSFRLHHKDWLSQTPMVSPVTLAGLLPLFRYALALCEKHSDAVEFPIKGPYFELEHVHTRVMESQQSLADGQWQATAEGAGYAERHGAMRAKRQGTLPDPFAGLQAACRDLDQVLAQLQSTLIHGPAPRPTEAEAVAQASHQQGLPAQDPAGAATSSPALPRSYRSVLSTNLPAAGSEGMTPRQPAPPLQPAAKRTEPATKPSTRLVTDSREPYRTPRHRSPATLQGPKATRGRAVPNTAAPTLPPHQTRPRAQTTEARGAAPSTRPPTPPASPPALRPAAAPAPSSPTATVAAPPPVDPATEAAAQLRQEQLAALKAALAPLQDEARSLSEAAEAVASRGAAGDRPWDLHTLEFKAWEAVVKAHDACADKLKAEAGASSVLDSEGPAVRSLQGAIDKASGRALERAARAADDTLTAFARACDTALVQGDPDDAGVGSYATLAEHCRELHGQWQENPLRPRLSALEGRMAQYGVYEIVSRVMDKVPGGSTEGFLFNAEQLHLAATLSRRTLEGAHGVLDGLLRAFCKSCTTMRSDMLEDLIHEEVDNARDTFRDLSTRLQHARRKSAEVATACDTLLIGDPLSQPQAREPGSPAAPVQSPRPALPETDRSLIDAACQAADAAREQRGQAIGLPAHAVPQQTLHLQKGVRVVLNQMELSAETIAAVLERFHLLTKTLGTTPHEGQPALVGVHANAMEQRAADLRKALDTHYAASNAVNDPTLRKLMALSQSQLGADLRLARRMHVSLRTLEQLLDTRVSARRLHGELEQNRLPGLAGTPEFNGQAHHTISQALEKGMKSVERELLKEGSTLTPEAWLREKAQHDLVTSAVQRKIDGESALIQGRLLLTLDAKASSPGSGHPSPPHPLLGHRAKVAELVDSLEEANNTLKTLAASSEHKDRYLEQHAINGEVRHALQELKLKIDGDEFLIEGQRLLALAAEAGSQASGNPGRPHPLLGHRAKVAELFDSLTDTNKTLKELAPSSEHKDRYLEQHAINEEVRRGLLVLKLKLNPLDSQPPGTAASGSQVNAPAARPSGTTPAAAAAPKGSKSSRPHRHAKHK